MNDSDQGYFRVRAVAEYLRCKPWFIGQSIREGKLPFIRMGKTFVIEKSDLDKFAQRLKSQS